MEEGLVGGIMLVGSAAMVPIRATRAVWLGLNQSIALVVLLGTALVMTSTVYSDERVSLTHMDRV